MSSHDWKNVATCAAIRRKEYSGDRRQRELESAAALTELFLKAYHGRTLD